MPCGEEVPVPMLRFCRQTGAYEEETLEISHTFWLILLVFILTEVSCSPFSLMQGLAVKCLTSGLAIIKKNILLCLEKAIPGSKRIQTSESRQDSHICLYLHLTQGFSQLTNKMHCCSAYLAAIFCIMPFIKIWAWIFFVGKTV